MFLILILLNLTLLFLVKVFSLSEIKKSMTLDFPA